MTSCGYYLRHKRKGFTIIEVSLAVAIGGLLFIGILGSTMANINHQRYNDSVQSFSNFLRNVYGEVVSVQNPRNELTGSSNTDVLCTANSENTIKTSGVAGRSNCLIYGKLITIGENGQFYLANVYDVVGDNKGNQEDISSLKDLNLDVLTRKKISGTCQYALAGNSYQYRLEWDANIKTTSGANFTGSVLIIRNPKTNVVNTSFYNQALSIQDAIGKNTGVSVGNCAKATTSIPSTNSYSSQLLSNDNIFGRFQPQDINFCIASDEMFAYTGLPRMVTMLANGSNSSAVKLWNQGEGSCRNEAA